MKKKPAKELPLHHRIVHHVRNLHRIRKLKERGLPSWKEKWGHFNEQYLGWLERFVEFAIPWLVFLLLFIILGEYSSDLNFFHWAWVESVSLFFEHYESIVAVMDKVIVGFFVVDLYFNFFKKKTVMDFLRTSILDIIAVAPMGAIFDLAGIAETQKAMHATTELEKEAARLLRGEEAAAKLVRVEEAAKLTRYERIITKVPRFFRLNRLADFFGKKKK